MYTSPLISKKVIVEMSKHLLNQSDQMWDVILGQPTGTELNCTVNWSKQDKRQRTA